MKTKLLWLLFVIGVLFLICGGYVLLQDFGVLKTLEIVEKLPNNIPMLISVGGLLLGIMLISISLTKNKLI
ncbi:TPA: hypothetical protein DIC38_02970 [Candidatus Nomurabacteria bacterium]|nr:hypothetical protein [Candidatus Nomurabacteria bacterium]